ncbi:MAG: alanine racemase [Clostridia bacterium]|nr:alanine racemase [Clostridia bacterium]
MRRTWAEIDLPALSRNLKLLSDRRPQTAVMAVVKADAYGHGAPAVATALSRAGVRHFAVATVGEALALREAGIGGEILILGYTPPEAGEVLLQNDLTQTLLSEDYAAALWAACPAPIKCHFAVDTGMHRIGLDATNPHAAAAVIRRYAARFSLMGIFTHLCAADTTDEASVAFTRAQIAAFRAVADRVRDLGLSAHCLNSAGGLAYPAAESDFWRLGILLYGLSPNPATPLPAGICPVLAWRTVVATLKTVPAGETVGYGRTWQATRDSVIATLPVGYADGYDRRLSNRGYVLLRGCRAPIVGRVCMDQTMVDVTDIPAVRVGDTVTLLGEDGGATLTADEMAVTIGTIGYEIVTGISARVPRIYKE